MREYAEAARTGGRALLQLSSEERSNILRAVAAQLMARKEEILDANAIDLKLAQDTNLEKVIFLCFLGLLSPFSYALRISNMISVIRFL